jgi:hypothetical protein
MSSYTVRGRGFISGFKAPFTLAICKTLASFWWLAGWLPGQKNDKYLDGLGYLGLKRLTGFVQIASVNGASTDFKGRGII